MKNDSNNSDVLFLRSALDNTEIESVLEWIQTLNNTVEVKVTRIPFDSLSLWKYDNILGALKHSSGKFFSIEGIHVKTNWGNTPEWEQPIINQPEIGFLGIITKEINGVLYFLMQAKIEPGNVNNIQLSPTLQATRSNYTQVHKGKQPLYLDFFKNASHSQIILDQLQSEQGARFLKKRNRNIIIKIDSDIPVYNNFIWLSLGQIKKLIQYDNIVNMDTRTVISGITYGSDENSIYKVLCEIDTNERLKVINEVFLRSCVKENNTYYSIDEIISFLTNIKSKYDLEINKVPLNKLKGWVYNNNEVVHVNNKYFKVIAVDVEIDNREVVKWGQPMIEPAQEGLCAFICKEINGILHFIVQAKLECGNHDIIELAPTVQCLTGNYRQTKDGSLPFLDYILNVKKEQIVFDTIQSEEGGRFYREQNRNMIVIAGIEIDENLPQNYIWMTLNQLFTFLKFNNFLNIQARSLISAISFMNHE